MGGKSSGSVDFSRRSEAAADHVGRLLAVFTTAVQPGDNHRVAATPKESALNVLTETAPPPGPPQTQFQVPASNEEVELFIGDLSPLLTVWRKLRIEVDSMAAVDASNSQAGTVQAAPTFNPGNNHAIIDIADLESEFRTAEQHRVGRIDIANYGSFTTVHTFIGGDHDQVEIINAPANIVNASGAQYTLWDDDAGSVPPFVMVGFNAPPVVLPRMLDTGLMERVYAGAYVLPLPPDPQHYDSTTLFDRNVANKTDAANRGNDNRDVTSSEKSWAVHITSAFQGYVDKDADPDGEQGGEGLQYGISVENLWGTRSSGSLVYLETIRDARYGNPATMQTLERYTVVHESGHQFLLQHEDGRWPNPSDTNPVDDFIMTDKTNDSGMAPNVAFSPTSRNKIRTISYPPQP